MLAPDGKGHSEPERKGQFQPDEKGQTRLSLVCFTWKDSALQAQLPASPTVKECCEKWLLMQSANVRTTTLIDYTSKVNRHIIAPLGHMRMTDVTADDIKLALVPVSQKSASVFKSVNILLKCIFNSAEDSKIITYNPTRFLSQKGGGIPQKDRESLTDEQVALLMKTIRDLPPYVFVMLGLYAGLRREEILALKWEWQKGELIPHHFRHLQR